MLVYNLSQKCLLAENIIIASTFHEKSVGLLQSSPATSLYMKTRWGIHTFGMRFPLTILVCDDTLRVKVLFRCVEPNRIIVWWPGWQHVFELSYKGYGVRIGDKLGLK